MILQSRELKNKKKVSGYNKLSYTIPLNLTYTNKKYKKYKKNKNKIPRPSPPTKPPPKRKRVFFFYAPTLLPPTAQYIQTILINSPNAQYHYHSYYYCNITSIIPPSLPLPFPQKKKKKKKKDKTYGMIQLPKDRIGRGCLLCFAKHDINDIIGCVVLYRDITVVPYPTCVRLRLLVQCSAVR